MKVRIIETSQKVKKKKVCAYVRVSKNEPLQMKSLKNQTNYYKRKITNNPNYEYAGVFVDGGITGTTEKRPELQRMISLAKTGEIDLIITKSVSRFARNTVVTLEMVRELKEAGVGVIFEKENINTLLKDSELMLAVLSSYAQEESRSISENAKWGIRKKFENGEVIINTERFLGYDKDENGNLVINKKEAKIIERIFKEYLSGKGCFTIAKEFNEENIPTVTGAKWNESTILQMLKNEKYKGDAILQKYYSPNYLNSRTVRNNGVLDSYYIQNNHEAIVPRELWEEVQIEIKKRATANGNTKETKKKYQNRYPLTKMLYCSKCGATLRRRTWNSKLPSKKIVWQCSNYVRNGKKACDGTSIADEVISKVNIKEETIVKEVLKNGKKDYIYSSKN